MPNKNSILLQFSKNLRALRNKSQYTQIYVSIKTGIDISLYQKYESNNCPNIGLLNLVKILDFFKVPLEEVLK